MPDFLPLKNETLIGQINDATQDMQPQTNEELIELIKNSAGAAKEKYLLKLFGQNYGMIHQISKQYSFIDDIEDIEQQAFIGLWIAVDRYDPDEGLFLTYAAYWIRQAIRRYIDDYGSVLRLPVHVKDMIYKYNKVVKAYRQQAGKEPTDEDLMYELQISREQLKKLKDNIVLFRTASLDKPIVEDDDTITLADAIADPNDQYKEIENQIDNDIMKDILWSEVSLLDAHSADVIKRRFRDQETLQDIGDAYGVSKERIRKIERDALRKLRLSKKIREYSEEYYSAKAYSGTGLSAFITSGSSSVERVALDRYMKNLEKTMRRVNKKYGIQLDEGFIQEQLAKREAELSAKYKA